jgi:hypothetical protein
MTGRLPLLFGPPASSTVDLIFILESIFSFWYLESILGDYMGHRFFSPLATSSWTGVKPHLGGQQSTISGRET